MTKNVTLVMINLLFSPMLFAQVGINTTHPAALSGLHVSERVDPASASPDKYNGVLIQRYTEAERDAQLTPNMTAIQNSLLIYNTTENCYNYWNQSDQEWGSLCGKLGKSTFSFDCSSIQVKGTYIKGKELGSSNYLNIPVTVTKRGEYTLTATTSNGYSFSASGTFLGTGPYTIQATAQGIPLVAQTDNLVFKANGIDVTCNPPVTVNVLSDAGHYTMSCGMATVNGVYKVGSALSSSNTITLPINTLSLGSYSITTNTVDGISFSASGTFTATGNQNITLAGSGSPTSTAVKTLTINSNSQGVVSTSCNINITVVIPSKKLLTIGASENGYGYNFSGIAASNKLITTSGNYGTLANSVVKFGGWGQIINGTDSPNTVQLTDWLLGPSPVDIVVLGYSWTITDADADVLVQYLAKGGVVLAYSESNAGIQRMFRKLFANTSITTASANSAGALYSFPYVNDEILNGPFGDIRGMKWGEDASSTTYASNLPTSDLVLYSDATNLSSASPLATAGRVTAFRHKTLNLVWVGDGGFNSNTAGNSSTICPFKLDAAGLPVFKPSYGNTAGYQDNVYNAVFTSNVFAWAIKKAEFGGINTH